MLTVRDLSKNKTVPANFNLLCEGQKATTQDEKAVFQHIAHTPAQHLKTKLLSLGKSYPYLVGNAGDKGFDV